MDGDDISRQGVSSAPTRPACYSPQSCVEAAGFPGPSCSSPPAPPVTAVQTVVVVGCSGWRGGVEAVIEMLIHS